MTVLSFGLDGKFGGEGLAALGIDADDRLPNARLGLDDALENRAPPVLLLFHGQRKRTGDLLRKHEHLHVVHIKSSLHRYGGLADREHELEFAVPSLRGGGRWEKQPDEVKSRLRGFVESFRRGRPDWTLLEAPTVPEYVIACYLTAVAGGEAPTDWRRGFEREAAAVEAGPSSWEERRDAARMRELLLRAGAVRRTPARPPAAEPPRRFDVIALPGLPCDVAREAGRCRHSFLENVFQVLNDRGLAAWLDDEREVRAFAASARLVRDHAAGFSPSAMLPQIAPLARLPPDALGPLRQRLDNAFRRAFAPAEIARGLGARLEALLAAMRARTPGNPAPEPLARIRRAARALHVEMTRLPDGFWLPPPGDGGETGPRARPASAAEGRKRNRRGMSNRRLEPPTPAPSAPYTRRGTGEA